MESKEFFYHFGKLLYQIDAIYDEFAKKYKVKANILWILYSLNDGNEHTQKEISENWSIPKTTLNTLIKELEKDKYIELIPIEGEKRELNIKLTLSGKKYADEILNNIYEIENKVFNLLPNQNVINDLEIIKKGLKEYE
jgi:transcriptional regulator